MVTANVSPERQTSPQNGKRPPRAARNGKRSRVTANVPESQISSNQLKWFVSLTIVTEPALTCNDLPTGPCAPKITAHTNVFKLRHAPISKRTP